MLEDLDTLARKVRELAEMAQSLRTENQQLRAQLAAASTELETMRGRVEQATIGIDHIRSIEIRAVVELHTSAQLELPSQRIGRAPAFCQTWSWLLVHVLTDQGFEDMPCQHVVGRQIMVMRVKRGHGRGLGLAGQEEA